MAQGGETVQGKQQSILLKELRTGIDGLREKIHDTFGFDDLGMRGIRHYNDYNVSMTRLLRRDWIINTPREKRDEYVYFIKDNGAMVPNATEALLEGYKVKLLTGPELKDAATRESLAELLQQYGSGAFSIRSSPRKVSDIPCYELLQKQLDRHSRNIFAAIALSNALRECGNSTVPNIAIINKNIVMEGAINPEYRDYEWAQFIERVTSSNIRHNKEIFSILSEEAVLKDTPDKVRQMPTIRK
jgi:hypothetical protein